MVNLWKRSHQPKHQRLKIHLHWRQMRPKNADQWGSHLTTGGAWPPMLNSQLESSPHQELQGKDHPVINNRFYILSKKNIQTFSESQIHLRFSWCFQTSKLQVALFTQCLETTKGGTTTTRTPNRHQEPGWSFSLLSGSVPVFGGKV